MKFAIGSNTDSAHCAALKHEFLRCEEAFKEFETFGQLMIIRAQAQEVSKKPMIAHETRWVAFKTYNAYARFVHHLYEFLLGACAREKGDTGKILAAEADRWIQGNAQRVLTGRRNSILNGTAPSWENHISAFPETVPAEFAGEFRAVRRPRPNIRVTSRHLVGVPVCSKSGRGRSGKIWPSHIFPACRFAIRRLNDGLCDQIRSLASRTWRIVRSSSERDSVISAMSNIHVMATLYRQVGGW